MNAVRLTLIPLLWLAGLYAAPAQSFNLGETDVLPLTGGGSGDVLVAQRIVLEKPAIPRALAFFVERAAGTLRLAIYDDARNKVAETGELVARPGWLSSALTAPKPLPPGTYWLAYLASSNELEFRKVAQGSGRWTAYRYGPMPDMFPDSVREDSVHWSFYATFNEVPPPRATANNESGAKSTFSSPPSPPPGFPNANSTGVPAGVTLTPSGGLNVDKPGTVISGLDIKGAVVINAANVTLQRSRITTGDFFPVRIMPGATGAVVQDCEINGLGAAENSSGIFGDGTFLRNNIYGVENGIALSGGGSTIEGNYIHDLQAPGSPHYDGIQIDGNESNVVIRRNAVINPWGQTSAIMIDNYFGPIANITVDGNFLAGGGFTIYVANNFKGGPVSNVSITNNVLQRGQYGYFAFYTSNPTVSGNVDSRTGRPVR